MMKYLLDTNIPLYLEDTDSPFNQPVQKRFQQLQDEDQVFMSVLSIYELYYGVALRKKGGEEHLAAHSFRVIESIKKRFTLLPLTGKEASTFGEMKSLYKDRSKRKENKQETIKKHDIDFIIASTAIEFDLVVVSNDTIFQHIKELYPDLRFENWV